MSKGLSIEELATAIFEPDETKAAPVGWMWPGLVLVDLETTGLEAGRHCAHEAAFLAWTGAAMEIAFRSRPGAQLVEEALGVCGVTWRDLDGREMSFCAAAAEAAAWLKALPCERITVAALNPGFDLPMLADLLSAVPRGARPGVSHRTVDLHTEAVRYARALDRRVPESGFTTEAIYALLGMEPEPRPHRAGNGVLYEARAFARIDDTLMRASRSLREPI